MATAKHPIVNDQEINRATINIVVDERTLREIYLAPFESAVKLAVPAATMGSFKKVNGDWAFPGFVESDYRAIHDWVKAAQAGKDTEAFQRGWLEVRRERGFNPRSYSQLLLDCRKRIIG